ncbi:hypothetical protein [Spiroplasma ixodetis]|uniref:Uncharacterized protein n=1 Tax=Spiroplasma ixodetis TaxID=2141 RepID=A0ABM8BUS6_9MOLU|nr:hypothetical protein [Spiroplasma ixodetis]BDT03624.1 hypothetical protein SHM_12700 [Spiroplasma ixodetis]
MNSFNFIVSSTSTCGEKFVKLYDDLVDDNENEIYRGPVSKFINKGYVATDYDKETETMILDWPDEIGTLPPEALQNNPQIGDYTHAPTCDFSAKQQKRITTNENNIKLLEAFLPLCTIFKSYHINAEKSLSTNFSPHF